MMKIKSQKHNSEIRWKPIHHDIIQSNKLPASINNVHTWWRDSVKVLFTKPYFQHHLKSSLINWKCFESALDLKSYCVGAYISQPQQSGKAIGMKILTKHVIVLFLWGLDCFKVLQSVGLEWSGDHTPAHTAWYAEIDQHHQCLARSSVNWESPMRLKADRIHRRLSTADKECFLDMTLSVVHCVKKIYMLHWSRFKKTLQFGFSLYGGSELSQQLSKRYFQI